MPFAIYEISAKFFIFLTSIEDRGFNSFADNKIKLNYQLIMIKTHSSGQVC